MADLRLALAYRVLRWTPYRLRGSRRIIGLVHWLRGVDRG